MSASRIWMKHAGHLGLAVTVAGTLLAGPVMAQDSPVPRKLKRQIDVLEQVLNQVLLDSPNFLVSGRNAAGGLYLDEYGVLMTFSASLVQKDKEWNWSWNNKFKVEHEDGKIIVYMDDDEADDKDADEIRKEFSEWQDKKNVQEERLYERGKTEIMDMMLDYGDTVSGLRDNQWLTVAAFLGKNDFFQDRKISHLVIKAKMADLKSYGAGSIDEKSMRERIVVEEY